MACSCQTCYLGCCLGIPPRRAAVPVVVKFDHALSKEAFQFIIPGVRKILPDPFTCMDFFLYFLFFQKAMKQNLCA